MIRCKGLPSLLRSGWVMAIVAVIATLAAVLAPQPRASAEGGDWRNVLMVYTTDIKGKIEPCG